MNSIIRYDIALFTKINGVWHNSFLDWLCPLLRNQFFWSPLYLFLLVFMLLNFGRRGFYWILFFLATFAMADMLSSSVIKPMAGRLRPCNNPLLADTIRSLVSCGTGKSFTSSHAANHFALGMFSFRTFLFAPLFWRWSFLFWAFIISYSQVYVGVHFPLDITCGAILGCLIGGATSKLFNSRVGLAALA
ncbi:MAG: phosphatase PAP2 family protein [Chitinophagaceae bacterium]|nr:phosphatase PAP2 family protein [Chitinophagaceae bacterium]